MVQKNTLIRTSLALALVASLAACSSAPKATVASVDADAIQLNDMLIERSLAGAELSIVAQKGINLVIEKKGANAILPIAGAALGRTVVAEEIGNLVAREALIVFNALANSAYKNYVVKGVSVADIGKIAEYAKTYNPAVTESVQYTTKSGVTKALPTQDVNVVNNLIQGTLSAQPGDAVGAMIGRQLANAHLKVKNLIGQGLFSVKTCTAMGRAISRKGLQNLAKFADDFATGLANIKAEAGNSWNKACGIANSTHLLQAAGERAINANNTTLGILVNKCGAASGDVADAFNSYTAANPNGKAPKIDCSKL
jgi:hypothetical protein